MKKSALFLIAVVCLLAVIIVTFFGQAVEMGQFSNPIKTIVIQNEMTGNIIMEDFNENNSRGVKRVYIRVTTIPEEPDDPSALRFAIVDDDDSDDETASDDSAEATRKTVTIEEDTGIMEFLAPDMVKVSITATDGGGAYTEVFVLCA